jgi:mannonate dehydratase
VGVNHAVGILPYERPAPDMDGPRDWRQVHGQFSLAETARDEHGHYPWEYEPLAAAKARFAEAGLALAVIESSPPMEHVRQGLDGRDEEIEQVGVMLKAMGRLGIGVWCYNFLAQATWGRTALELPTRGGAVTTAFNLADVPEQTELKGPQLSHDKLWDNLRYFLERIVAVAEEAGVKLAMHPDDPPVPWVGKVPRILNTLEAFDRLLDIAPSPAHGITFCQGNFGLMTRDLPEAIRHFGQQGKIHFVHFRDVRGTADNFQETFHDDGPTDMLACLRAYGEIGYTGVLRPDHVPTLAGETNASPGYATLGRLHAVGYIRGLAEAAFGREAARAG